MAAGGVFLMHLTSQTCMCCVCVMWLGEVQVAALAQGHVYHHSPHVGLPRAAQHPRASQTAPVRALHSKQVSLSSQQRPSTRAGVDAVTLLYSNTHQRVCNSRSVCLFSDGCRVLPLRWTCYVHTVCCRNPVSAQNSICTCEPRERHGGKNSL